MAAQNQSIISCHRCNKTDMTKLRNTPHGSLCPGCKTNYNQNKQPFIKKQLQPLSCPLCSKQCIKGTLHKITPEIWGCNSCFIKDYRPEWNKLQKDTEYGRFLPTS